MDAGSPGPTPAVALRKIGGSDQRRMTGTLFVTVAAFAVALSVSAHASACQASFRQVNQIGLGEATKLYARGLQKYNGPMYFDTLNDVDDPQIWRFDESTWERVRSLPVVTNCNTGLKGMVIFEDLRCASTVKAATS